ncbi:MAG: TolC family protein [Chlorobium sp.]|nr:MAG: TolC family protein [Chlorobium sp.]
MNRIRPGALFLSFLLLLITPLHLRGEAVSSVRLTLEDAVRIGLEKSRTLEIARLDRAMADQKIRESWSDVLPHISVSSSYTRTLKPSVLLMPPNQIAPTGVLTTSSDNQARGSIDLRQTLFDQSAFAGIRAAGIVRNMSDEAYRGAEANVVTDIKLAYFDALISKEQLLLLEQSMARWEQSRKDTRAMFRQGVVADIDTLKAWLSVENLRPELMQAENRVASSMTRLKNVMGIPVDSSVALGSKLVVSGASYPTDIAEAYREAVEARPELRQLDYQVQAEGEKVNAARAEHFPLLSAFGKLESQTAFKDGTSPSNANWPTSSSVGLQLTMPLFTGFRISSKVEQAKIGQLQTRTRYEELKANIRAEVELRVLNVKESQKRTEVQSKTISVAERNYTISQLRFKEGIGSRLELTDAELQLNKAKTNYLQAVYDNLAATTQLEKALGRRVAR